MDRRPLSKAGAVIAIAAVAVLCGGGALAVSLKGALTPDERTQLDALLFVVMGVGAASVGGFVASSMLQARAIDRNGTRLKLAADFGIVVSAVGFTLSFIAGPIGIMVHAFCPLETRGEARFRPDGGRVGGSEATIRLRLPDGWRFRYGRQSWREGTAIDETGAERVRVSVALIDADAYPHRDGALVGYAATRERGRFALSLGGRTTWRAGRLGPEWVLSDGGSKKSGPSIEIAAMWLGRIVTLWFTRIGELDDFNSRVDSWLADAVFDAGDVMRNAK
ncbi:MAG: hypothetical protein HYY84_09020 [Deltaproteobacteria bacterium]|nr:hypothetical protein [Deltaproteobacteria bacterium]